MWARRQTGPAALAGASARAAFTDALAQAYKKSWVKVTYKTYAGVSHGGIVNSAAADATSFIRARVGR